MTDNAPTTEIAVLQDSLMIKCNERLNLTRKLQDLHISSQNGYSETVLENLKKKLKEKEDELSFIEYECEFVDSMINQLKIEDVRIELEQEYQIYQIENVEKDFNKELIKILDGYRESNKELQAKVEEYKIIDNLKRDIFEKIIHVSSLKTKDALTELKNYIYSLDRKILANEMKLMKLQKNTSLIEKTIETEKNMRDHEDSELNELIQENLKIARKIRDIDDYGISDKIITDLLKDDDEMTDIIRYNNLKQSVPHKVRIMMNDLEKCINKDISKLNVILAEVRENIRKTKNIVKCNRSMKLFHNN